MVTKCIEHLNSPQELGLYLDTPVPTKLSLKKLISHQFLNEKIPASLTLIITIAPHAHIYMIDDLGMVSSDFYNKLHFVLNQDSRLEYTLRVESCKQEEQNKQTIDAYLKKDLVFILNGKQAEVNAQCLFEGKGSTQFIFNAAQKHQAENTISTFSLKSALDDQASLKGKTTISVSPRCNNVVAQEEIKTMLLGKLANISIVPELEVESHDIQCHHKAMVSNVNNEQLFYLQSRGFTETQARQELVRAFLS